MVNPLLDYMLITSNSDSPIIVIITIVIFMTFRRRCANFHFLDNLAPLCFITYIIHPFLIYALYLFLDWTPVKYPLPLFLSVTILVAFTMSFGTAFCVKKLSHGVYGLFKKKG
jgi:membrane-bound acyltransferase YfiQ involved in biofilm formation